MDLEKDIRPLVADLVRMETEFREAIDGVPPELWERPFGGGWSPSEHFQHLVMTVKTVTASFRAQLGRPVEPRPPKDKRTWFKRVLFLTQMIPPNRPAPDAVRPFEIQSREAVFEHWKQSRDAFRNLIPEMTAAAEKGQWIEHVALGPLDFAEWTRFLLIHARHHIRLVRRQIAANTLP